MLNDSQSYTPAALDIMHYHLDTAPNNSTSIAKRHSTRLMDQCTGIGRRPRPWTFLNSHCKRMHDLQELVIYCSNDHYVQLIGQSCRSNELCIDTNHLAENSKAYCISVNNFYRIPNSERQRVIGDFEMHLPTYSSKPSAVNVLMVDQSRSRGLRGADLLELSAIREFVPISAGVRPQRVVLDRVHCVGCYELELQHLTSEITTLGVQIDIHGSGPGYLYLVTIS